MNTTITIETACVSAVSALTALLAVWLGPKLQFEATRQQSISQHRQKWINDLRDEVSTFLALVATYSTTGDVNVGEKALASKFRIRLLLNSTERDSQKLLAAIDDYNSLALKALNSQDEDIDFSESVTQITSVTANILKSEWERVKQMGKA